MSNRLKIAGRYALDFLTAVIGPAVIIVPLRAAVPLQSTHSRIFEECCLSIFLAAALVVFCQRSWGRPVSKWVWIPATLLFAFGSVAFAGSDPKSAFFSDSNFWERFSGLDCGIDRWSCVDFYIFTVPLIRTISFSLAAYVWRAVPGSGAPRASFTRPQ